MPMTTTMTIDGRRVRLRAAALADRRMIHDWSYASDVAPLLHLSDPPSRPFDDWCDDWEEHYFMGAEPERGRMFVVLDGETPVGAIAHHAIDERRRVELDIWLNAEATCGRGLGTDAIEALCAHLEEAHGVRTFMMQPSARNPRAVRAYEKVGFVQVPATAEEIAADWGEVDHPDSVLMLREVERARTSTSARATARAAAYAGGMEVPSMTHDPSVSIELPEPSRTGAVSLEEAMARRRSVRAFGPDPLTLEHVAQLAWSAQGVTEAATGYRTAPSAGGTLPVEVDLVVHGVPDLEDGVYRYLPAEHALQRRLAGDRRAAVADATLNQGFVRDAPVIVALSSVAARTAATFGDFADRLIDMEVGHVGQNVSLQAVALGLGTVVVAGVREAELAAALALDEGERPIYLMPVGRAASTSG